VPRKPKKEDGEQMTKTLIYLSDETRQRLKHMAVDDRVSMAELIRQALAEFLDKRKGGRR
jgi:predicted transcriptional regulator